MSRILVNNTWVASEVGDTIVMEQRVAGHKRTVVFSRDRLTVTVRGVTEEIALPWLKRQDKAA